MLAVLSVVRSGRLWIVAPVILLSSCLGVLRPAHQFAPEKDVAAAPDYRMEENWAALPDHVDSADAVPRGTLLQDRQRDAPVDVFFVHPTTHLGRGHWNADLTNKALNRITDATTIRKQASVFNSTARIYAPRYRQATLYSFFDEKTQNGEEAIELAYTDVKAAFQYYLDNYNRGRPIILAGHSQGTRHLMHILQDFFDHDPRLRQQLVAAYLIGFNVPEEALQAVRPCEDSTQTGCYVAWNTADWGQEYAPYRNSVATNPLTWTRDTATAEARLNLGGVPSSFNRRDTRVVDAKVHNGLLWVHKPVRDGYPRFLLPGRPELHHSYHIADYSLFYYNIRQNAEARVRAYRMKMSGG